MILLMMVAAVVVCHAQDEDVEAAEYEPRYLSAGFRVGSSVGDVRLSAECYDEYDHVWAARPAGSVWMHYRTPFGLGLRPEVAYIGRGTRLQWADVDYTMTVHTLNIRLGITWNFKLKNTKFSPYLIAAPSWLIALGGKVTYKALDVEEVEMPLTTASVAKQDVRLFAGAGFEMPIAAGNTAVILALEAGYAMGFLETFTALEHSGELTVLNRTLDTRPAAGDRKWQGIEVTFGVGMPFGPKIVKKRPSLKKILEN